MQYYRARMLFGGTTHSQTLSLSLARTHILGFPHVVLEIGINADSLASFRPNTRKKGEEIEYIGGKKKI